MKATWLFTIIILLTLVLSGCGGKAKVTAQGFFSALEKHDFEMAKQYTANDSKEVINSMENWMENLSQSQREALPELSYKITEVKENGDQAVVSYDITENGNDDRTISRDLNLVMSNGAWKVRLPKDFSLK